jgi:hypothetical protein
MTNLTAFAQRYAAALKRPEKPAIECLRSLPKRSTCTDLRAIVDDAVPPGADHLSIELDDGLHGVVRKIELAPLRLGASDSPGLIARSAVRHGRSDCQPGFQIPMRATEDRTRGLRSLNRSVSAATGSEA